MPRFIRPIILPSLASLICAFAVLSFPQYFPVVSTVVFAVVLLVFVLLFARRQRYLAVIFAITVLFTAFNSMRVYTSRQLYAERFTDAVSQSGNAVFTATVSEAKNFGSYSIVYADVSAVNGKSISKSIPARLGCYSAGELLDGDVITFSGKPRKLSDIPKDGFNTENYLKSKYIFCDFDNACVISSSAADDTSFIQVLKRHIKDVIFTYVRDGYDTSQSSICYAMFAGDKDYLTDMTKQSFSRSGLTHLLCVSGMHLTILSGFAFSLLSFFTLHKRLKCLLIISLCIFYTCLTGFSMSTVRSCIICILTFSAMMSGRKTDGYVSLFFAMAVICALSPYSVYDISAQLSFLSAFGIICFSDILPGIHIQGRLTKVARLIIEALKSNSGAVIFSLPVVSFYFGEFSTVSVLSTLCVSFICRLLLISLVILVSISFIDIFPFGDTVLYFIGSICRTLCIFISEAADFFASFRFSRIVANETELYLTGFVLLMIFLIISIGMGFVRTKFISAMLIVLLTALFSFSALFSAIIDNGHYSVSYYRKSAEDRQMTIKLGNNGYLIVNADNRLCLSQDEAEFDAYGERNYLLIIPCKGVSPKLLAESIGAFEKEFGIKGIFTTDTDEGISISKELSVHGIDCKVLPHTLDFGNLYIEYTDGDYFGISADDGRTKTTVVFADEYDEVHFGKDSDICAYFTMHTKNQFSLTGDIPPECGIFYTRLGKSDSAGGIFNTYGLSSFYIKE